MESPKESKLARRRNAIHNKKSMDATKVTGLKAARVDQDNRKEIRNRSNDMLVPTSFKSNQQVLEKVALDMQKAIDHELKSGPTRKVTDFDKSSQKLTELECDRFRAVKLCRRYNRVSSFRSMLLQGFPLTEKQIKMVFTVVSVFMKKRKEAGR